MPKIEQSQLRQEDKIVVRNTKNNEVLNVIFPIGIQVGLDALNFNFGITLPNLNSSPSQTTNVLYARDGDIYFNGVLVAPSAGSNLTVKDEGTTLTSTAASIDFTGSGITATAVGNNVTVTTEADGETQILASQVFG
jgi:hypothetical protein